MRSLDQMGYKLKTDNPYKRLQGSLVAYSKITNIQICTSSFRISSSIREHQDDTFYHQGPVALSMYPSSQTPCTHYMDGTSQTLPLLELEQQVQKFLNHVRAQTTQTTHHMYTLGSISITFANYNHQAEKLQTRKRLNFMHQSRKTLSSLARTR